MQDVDAPKHPPLLASGTVGVLGISLLAAFVYVVVVGGTGRGEVQPALRVLNAGIAGAVVVVCLLRARERSDFVDRGVALALILFACAGVLSQFPRQSFDAVLAAVAYGAAFFVARDYLAAEPVRTAFLRVLIGLSALFTVAVAVLWVPQAVEWWSLTDWTVVPPLDIQFSAGPWGHRYDVVLLIAMLYPAWWIGRPSPARRIAATAIGLLALTIIVITGSRTTWLALAIASAGLSGPALVRYWRRHPRVGVPAIAGILFVGVAAAVTGLAASLGQRALNLASLDGRLAMWEPLTELWLSNPIAGVGPGSFPWALQLTPYFDTRTWAPRHPDSPLFQLLPEAGLLGLAAVALIVLAVLIPIMRGRSQAARWVVLAFAVSCLGANPTDFGFLVALGLAWAAFAVPHNVPTLGSRPRRRARPVLITAFAATGVIVALAHASTLVGGFAYEAARTSVAAGAMSDARGSLEIAVATDPGMALYIRQLGTLHFLEGDDELAVHDLERAVSLNPSDDLAWRTLSLARARSGDQASAREALARAVTVQRSDPTNLLLSARMRDAEDDAAVAVTLLAEVVQSWPAIVAAPGWDRVLPASATTAEVVDAAARRWLEGAPTAEPTFDQGVWLGVLSGDAGVLQISLERAAFDPRMADALARLIGCDETGSRVIEGASVAERRGMLYWELRVRASALAGQLDLQALQALQIMTGRSFAPDIAGDMLNSLDEGGDQADRWGYRRDPISWPLADTALPSVHAGEARWLFDAREAVRAAGLGDRIDEC